MNIDKPHEIEIDRWENKGGSCRHLVVEFARAFDRSSITEASELLTTSRRECDVTQLE